MSLLINFNNDGYAMLMLMPKLERVEANVRFIIETILSDDEELYKEKWAATLIHTDRDRLVNHIAQVILKPIHSVLGRNFLHAGTPESMKIIIDFITAELSADDIIVSMQADTFNMDYSFTLLGDDGKMEIRNAEVSELLVGSVLEVLQVKLSGVYKEARTNILEAITKITVDGMVKRTPGPVRKRGHREAPIGYSVLDHRNNEEWPTLCTGMGFMQPNDYLN